METDIDFMYDERRRKLLLGCQPAAFSRLCQLLTTDPGVANCETAASTEMSGTYEIRSLLGDTRTIEIFDVNAEIPPAPYAQFYILGVIAVVIVGMLLMGMMCAGMMVWLDRNWVIR